ncbi:hypothetical protein BDR04DRAFT_104230 [Suillus decipiens]|nr:hypothetical protein BDR04DRAFT_104230 [Suillus decipiens]
MNRYCVPTFIPTMSDASSMGSTHSLCSHGSLTMDNPMGSQDNASSCKATTHWELEEERELISFLATHKSEAGDTMSFKGSVFTDAAIHLNSAVSHPEAHSQISVILQNKVEQSKEDL